MAQRGIQFSVGSMLGLVACVALNIWSFQVHPLLGIVALYVTKHVVIAQLCHAVGVNRPGPAPLPVVTEPTGGPSAVTPA